MSALTRLWTVIFLVSYIEADWSGRICTAGPTQWRNYGYQLTATETSVPSAPYRFDTPVLCFAALASVHLVREPRPPWSNKRSTDSKRWATGDNYPAHSRPVIGRSRQSRFSEVEKFQEKIETQDSRVSLTSLNITSNWHHVYSNLTDLSEYWFAVMCDHHSLLTVKYNGRVLKWFLAVLQYIVQISYSTLKHASKVAGNQATTNSWKNKYKIKISNI